MSAPEFFSTAAAEEDKKSDYNEPDAVVVVKKIAKTVIHI